MYKKILVPIDDSPCSKHALQEAIKLAKLTGGSITVTHVYQAEPVFPTSKDGLFELFKKYAEKLLLDAEKTVEREEFKVKPLLLKGDPVEQIVKVATMEKFDLIVMGAGGSGKLSEFVLGSTTHQVINMSTLPVLVVK